MNTQKMNVMIFHHTGKEPHMIKVTFLQSEWHLPVSGTSVNACKRMMRQVIKDPVFTVVEILNDEPKAIDPWVGEVPEQEWMEWPRSRIEAIIEQMIMDINMYENMPMTPDVIDKLVSAEAMREGWQRRLEQWYGKRGELPF